MHLTLETASAFFLAHNKTTDNRRCAALPDIDRNVGRVAGIG
jgi:hypothetical protein